MWRFWLLLVSQVVLLVFPDLTMENLLRARTRGKPRMLALVKVRGPLFTLLRVSLLRASRVPVRFLHRKNYIGSWRR